MVLSAQRNKYTRKLAARTLVLLLAMALIAYGIWGLWQRYRSTHNSNPTISTETVTYSTDKPDETQPSCDDSYTVPGDHPRQIDLPVLKKTGCIQPVGKDQNSAVAVPTNIHLAGWYVDSVLPGQEGVSLIDGHVRGRYGEAIFTGLEKLQVGDPIRIQLGDKSLQQFEVVEKETVLASKAAEVMLKQLNPVGKQLTLITCGGRFDRTTQQYEDRIIIRAKLR